MSQQHTIRHTKSPWGVWWKDLAYHGSQDILIFGVHSPPTGKQQSFFTPIVWLGLYIVFCCSWNLARNFWVVSFFPLFFWMNFYSSFGMPSAPLSVFRLLSFVGDLFLAMFFSLFFFGTKVYEGTQKIRSEFEVLVIRMVSKKLEHHPKGRKIESENCQKG